MRALSRAIVAVGLVLRLMAPAVAGPIDDGIAAGKRYVDGTDIAMKFISDIGSSLRSSQRCGLQLAKPCQPTSGEGRRHCWRLLQSRQRGRRHRHGRK